MESMQHVQEQLVKERQRCDYYRSCVVKPSVLLNTTDTGGHFPNPICIAKHVDRLSL